MFDALRRQEPCVFFLASLIQGMPGGGGAVSFGVKRLECEADHLTASGAKVSNALCYNSIYGVEQRQTFTSADGKRGFYIVTLRTRFGNSAGLEEFVASAGPHAASYVTYALTVSGTQYQTAR